MLRKLLGLAAVGYLAYRYTQGRGEAAKGSAHPSHHGAVEPLTNWEGEGGALPDQPGAPGQREAQPQAFH